MNPIIIIPAFNPNKNIFLLIKTIKSITNTHILIIDDGSNKKIRCDDKSCKVIRIPVNTGKGWALQTGFKYAIKNNFSHIITLDSDMQHDPNYIMYFLNTDKNIDIVLGNRNFQDNMPIHRRISNTLTSSIVSILVRKEVLDSQCGYRRYSVKSLIGLNFKEKGFQFETEILLIILKNNFSIKHINIPTIYNNSISNIKIILDSYYFIKLIFNHLFNKI